MFQKFASAAILDAHIATHGSMARTAHRAVFDYQPRPGYLYVRSRMISSRCNDNFDEFPAEEIEKGYHTFIGKPVFVNHHNEDHRRARGMILDAVLHKDALPNGKPDFWVEGLQEIDALTYPKLAAAIIRGDIDRTSMGVDVAHSVCSVCANKATTPLEYCRHIPALKGHKAMRRLADGSSTPELIRERCHGLSFFENSLLVEEPADPTAHFLDRVVAGPGLEHLFPRTASLDLTNQHRADAKAVANLSVRQLAATGSAFASRGQGQQGLDLAHLGFGELRGGVRYTSQTASSGHHVGGVLSVGAQNPVERVMAEREVAGVSNYLPGSDRADQVLVSPAMRTHRASSSIVQGQSSVPILEDPAGPWPAGIRTTAGVNVRPVPFQDRGGSNEFPAARHPADHGAYITRIAHGGDCPACGGSDTISVHGSAECVDCEHVYPMHRQAAPRYADPADHPFFQRYPVSHEHILDHWHAATDDEKASGKRWYADAGLVAKALGTLHQGPEHPQGNTHLAAGLIANYSPQTGWAANQHNAARALHEGHGIGGPGSGIFASTSQKKAADRMLAGEDHREVLKSPKVSDFAHLVEHGGDEHPEHSHVVIDRHALAVASQPADPQSRLPDDHYDKFPNTQRHYYGHVVDAYHKAAQHLSEHLGEPIAGHQVQATTWLARQRLNQSAEKARAAAGADDRMDRGRAKSRTNAEDAWGEFRQKHLPDLTADPGTGYERSAARGRRGRP